jgi:NADH-quinone oxidoreductase subunit F
MEDLELLDSLFGRISGKTLCPLADGAIAPIKSSIKYFREDFVRVIENGSPRPEPMWEVAGV